MRQLPVTSRAVAVIDGQPGWTPTDHLLADLWALIVKALTPDDKGSGPIDHPVRAERIAKAVAATKRSLKAAFLQRKTAYNQRRNRGET